MPNHICERLANPMPFRLHQLRTALLALVLGGSSSPAHALPPIEMLDLARNASSLAFELTTKLGDEFVVPRVHNGAPQTAGTRELISERVYMGTVSFGWRHEGAAEIDEKTAVHMLRMFAVSGGQHLDGAAVYPGEHVLGVAAAAAAMLIYPGVNAADGFLITSKAHPQFSGGLGPNGLREQLMRSRARLGYIDMPLAEYYLHQPDTAHDLLSSLEAMDRFVKEGLIERIGMQNYHAEEVKRAFELCEQHGLTKPSVFQCAASRTAAQHIRTAERT